MDAVSFIRQFPLRSFSKGEVLIHDNSSVDSLLAIRDGYVKVVSITDSGAERILWIAGRYDLVPAEHLFSSRGTTSYLYTAMTDGSVYDVDKHAFLTEANTSTHMMNQIARSMSSHYDDLLQKIHTVEQSSVQNKLICGLLYLAERFSADDTVDFYSLGLPLTHPDIADFLGVTRETTSVELHKLQAAEAIWYGRNFFIVYCQKLKQLTGK